MLPGNQMIPCALSICAHAAVAMSKPTMNATIVFISQIQSQLAGILEGQSFPDRFHFSGCRVKRNHCRIECVKPWEIIADNLKKHGWSWGWVSTLDCRGRTIWIADAHRGDGKRFVVHADEKLAAFLELESATHAALSHDVLGREETCLG
jgi:hypothetical protein